MWNAGAVFKWEVLVSGTVGVLQVDQTQPFEGQERVGGLDYVRQARHEPCLAARRDHLGRPAQLGHHALDHPFDLGYEAPNEPGLDRGDRVAADHGIRGDGLDPPEHGGVRNEGVERDLTPRGYRSAEVVALGVDGVVGDGGPEVDHHHRPAVFRIRGERVGDAIGADIFRILIADPHPGLDPRTDHDRLAFEVAARSLDQRGVQVGHDAGDDDPAHYVQLEAAEVEELAELHSHFVRGPLSVRGHAPVGDQPLALEQGQADVGVADVDGQ